VGVAHVRSSRAPAAHDDPRGPGLREPVRFSVLRTYANISSVQTRSESLDDRLDLAVPREM